MVNKRFAIRCINPITKEVVVSYTNNIEQRIARCKHDINIVNGKRKGTTFPRWNVFKGIDADTVIFEVKDNRI